MIRVFWPYWFLHFSLFFLFMGLSEDVGCVPTTSTSHLGCQSPPGDPNLKVRSKVPSPGNCQKLGDDEVGDSSHPLINPASCYFLRILHGNQGGGPRPLRLITPARSLRKGSHRFNRQSFLQLGHTKKTEVWYEPCRGRLWGFWRKAGWYMLL